MRDDQQTRLIRIMAREERDLKELFQGIPVMTGIIEHKMYYLSGLELAFEMADEPEAMQLVGVVREVFQRKLREYYAEHNI